MPRFRRNSSVRAVLRAMEEGDRRYRSGNVAGAIAQYEAGLRAEAVSSLDEAEELYKRLGGRATQLVADVVIRRANVRAELGAPLSAIEDVQQAVVASVKWGSRIPRERLMWPGSLASPHPSS